MKNFSEHTKAVFAAMNTDYEAMNNLMQDVALGREIYDAENDRVISKAEANAKILDFSRQILGITDVKDAKEVLEKNNLSCTLDGSAEVLKMKDTQQIVLLEG